MGTSATFRQLRRESGRQLPTLRLQALKEFDQQVIGTRCHQIPELRLLADGIAKVVTLVFHPGHESIEIVGLDADVMHRATSRRLGGLLVHVNECISQPHPYRACAGGVLVPDYRGIEHGPKEVDGDRQVGREEMDVVETGAHLLLDRGWTAFPGLGQVKPAQRTSNCQAMNACAKKPTAKASVRAQGTAKV